SMDSCGFTGSCTGRKCAARAAISAGMYSSAAAQKISAMICSVRNHSMRSQLLSSRECQTPREAGLQTRTTGFAGSCNENGEATGPSRCSAPWEGQVPPRPASAPETPYGRDGTRPPPGKVEFHLDQRARRKLRLAEM